MPKYIWKDEPETDSQRNMLQHAYNWVLTRLSDEERECLISEFTRYIDAEHKKGNAVTPAYIWVLNRIELLVKPIE